LAAQKYKYVEDYLSDAAAGHELALILDGLEDNYQHHR